MNIFALHPCPHQSARDLCDKHIVKMALETAQILCTVRAKYGHEPPYRPTHKHHPCVVWAEQDLENYIWLICHGQEICREYTKRYGKVHACLAIINDCSNNLPPLPDTQKLTPFALAMPNEYKLQCPHESYRNYYRNAKAKFLNYTNRQKPTWI